jgi:hypothetical protein
VTVAAVAIGILHGALCSTAARQAGAPKCTARRSGLRVHWPGVGARLEARADAVPGAGGERP